MGVKKIFQNLKKKFTSLSQKQDAYFKVADRHRLFYYWMIGNW